MSIPAGPTRDGKRDMSALATLKVARRRAGGLWLCGALTFVRHRARWSRTVDMAASGRGAKCPDDSAQAG